MTRCGTILCAVMLVVGGSGCPSKSGGSGSTAGSGGGTPAAETPTPGGTLVFARGNDSKSLDPIGISDGESVKVVDQIYEKLVTHQDTSTEIQPALAASWTTSDDRLTWTFTIRAGVHFHDGTPCDAAAVKFSLDRLIHENDPNRHVSSVPYRGEYKMIQAVAAPAPDTVVVTLNEPSAVLLANLAMFPASIVSPTAVRTDTTRFGQHPVGTGPFTFVKWDRGEKLVLKRNEAYWGSKAYLDRVIFVPIREQAARVERLTRGEAHMMDNVDFSFVQQITDHADTRYDKIPGMNFAYLALNVTHKPFDDVRVRRAVAHAIDRQAIVDILTDGYGTTGPNPMPPTVPGYNADVPEYAYDVAKAKALLAEAGHGGGLTLDLWVMNNPRPYMPKPVECGEILKSQLAKVGITCAIVSPPWGEYLDKTGNGEHPMCVLGWSSDNGDPDNFLNVLLSAHNADPPNCQNRALWKYQPCQDLLDEAARITDQARRLELYRQAQVIIHEQCPMVPLAYLPVGMAQRTNVRGYHLHPLQVRLSNVWLKQ